MVQGSFAHPIAEGGLELLILLPHLLSFGLPGQARIPASANTISLELHPHLRCSYFSQVHGVAHSLANMPVEVKIIANMYRISHHFVIYKKKIFW